MTGRDYVADALAMRDGLEVLELAALLRKVDTLRARVAELERLTEGVPA